MAEPAGIERRWTANDVARGVSRLLVDQGFSPIAEFGLASGRRLDVAAIGRNAEILGVEIKVCLADLRADGKWPDYTGYCDLFYFAVPPGFPQDRIPPTPGLIVADCYGGAIIRPASAQKLNPARRRAVMLRFAQCAAVRLARVRDPELS